MREVAWPEGRLRIAESALATVAAAAALACPGVVALGPPRLGDELAGLWREHGEGHEGARREPEVVVEPTRCTVTLEVVVAFGAQIEAVCREIVRQVGAALARDAEVERTVVDVRVVGVRPTGGQ